MFLAYADYWGILGNLAGCPGVGVIDFLICYDPMIGKLIVWATTREFAIERMRRVLYEYKITGLKTNIAYRSSGHNK